MELSLREQQIGEDHQLHPLVFVFCDDGEFMVVDQIIISVCCAGGVGAWTRSPFMSFITFPLAWLYQREAVWILAGLFLLKCSWTLWEERKKFMKTNDDDIIDVEFEVKDG